MQPTESWRRAVPASLHDCFRWVATRNAAGLIAAASPNEFDDMLRILRLFRIDVDRIVRRGGNKHLIAQELDAAFRILGWREARYEQRLETDLVKRPYPSAGEKRSITRTEVDEYGGHLIDNVKGRVGLVA